MPNPLLALQVQSPQIDIAGSFARGQEVRTMSLNNALKAYAMQKAVRDDERANALQQFYQQNGAGIASGNPESINNLAAIDPAAAQSFQKGALENQDAKIKTAMSQAEFMGRTAQGILEAPQEVRPLLYQRALAEAKAAGLPVDKAPPQYDEGAVKQMLAGAVSAKDQLTMAQTAARDAETKRHNTQTESNQIRGQNMVDARMRETNTTKGWRQMTKDEKKAANLPIDAAYQVNGEGKIERVAGNTSVRPIPASALAGITANKNAVRKIDEAIAALEGDENKGIKANPDAIGAKTYLGDAITQRMDPGGVTTRALVADIGSQQLHDRSGAAVTLSEAPRLQPFVPSVHDRSDVALAKLKNLRKQYEMANEETESFFSPEAGYMPVPGKDRQTVTQSKGVNTQTIDFNDLPDN